MTPEKREAIVTTWPGYTEAKMTDKSAVALIHQIEGTSIEPTYKRRRFKIFLAIWIFFFVSAASLTGWLVLSGRFSSHLSR